MQLALLVKSHPNARYAQSMLMLAVRECECLLFALNAKTDVRVETLAGTPFLILDVQSMPEEDWAYLARHSAVALAAVCEGEWLKPVVFPTPQYLDADLSQVLKYKGKTNPDFTRLMLNCARSASAFARSQEPLTVLDPICGRGTSLFCALETGDCAIGIETDEKAIHEADVYFIHSLQYHRYKHRREEHSLTLTGGGAVREYRYTFANSPEVYKQGRTLSMRLIRGDTRQTDAILGAEQCHLIVADLPYGVQHAPREGRGVCSPETLLREALPAYRKTLKQGGAIALAFNTYTLPRETVLALVQAAGFTPMQEPPFESFAHWVEQAVNRDLVVAVKGPAPKP